MRRREAALRVERYRLVRDAAIARAKKWREDNIDRFRENQRRMRQNLEFKRTAREYHLSTTHGLTLEEYDAMLAARGGGCAICAQPPRDDISLHVDHDHETGAIRGLRCFRCNNALGDLRDDADLASGAVAYLADHDPEMQELAVLVRQRVTALKG